MNNTSRGMVKPRRRLSTMLLEKMGDMMPEKQQKKLLKKQFKGQKLLHKTILTY